MDGQVLPKMNELSLRFIGINENDTIDHLVSSIQNLLKEHGAKTGIKESKSVDIPSEFLCPITNEVMKDPVIAFDGHTYERSKITDYLKQHSKSPVTGDAAEYSMVIPNKAMKKQIQAFLSANQHNLQESVEMAEEGVVETGYM